jgi:hypothetical protein
LLYIYFKSVDYTVSQRLIFKPPKNNRHYICFKLIENGYYNVVRNDVTLYHHESISRGIDNSTDEKMERLLIERKTLFDMLNLKVGIQFTIKI